MSAGKHSPQSPVQCCLGGVYPGSSCADACDGLKHRDDCPGETFHKHDPNIRDIGVDARVDHHECLFLVKPPSTVQLFISSNRLPHMLQITICVDAGYKYKHVPALLKNVKLRAWDEKWGKAFFKVEISFLSQWFVIKKNKRERCFCLLLWISHLADIRYTDEASRDEPVQAQCSVKRSFVEPIWEE